MSGNDASFTTPFKLPFGETLGVGGVEVDRASKGNAQCADLSLPMSTVVRTTVLIDFSVKTND